ncbi:maleylacetoacetate isomerase [Roseovarius sp.]|uniref:maleylacetoacetate isomerase n=1 Tax=Roseovarius sp. TaxID=1486281 RepID=UPI0026194A12|nr:maleylacetoacetate isomerase [Roseovarius sp.]MDM8165566.1 maleylacetoacetate isomerase [Roseovarius sp.]
MRLHTYWRSSTSYRVRIALDLKGIAYEAVPVDLLAGQQNRADHAALNPTRSVPVLELSDGTVLTQSMAILDWLDETHPKPPLLPTGPAARARVRAAALAIATEIHPINNLRVLDQLKSMGHGQAEIVDWMNTWMSRGLVAFAGMIANDTPFCFGKTPGLADICLVPQLYNAHRWGCDLDPFRRLREIEARCLALPAFDGARPEQQHDAT